MHTVSHRCLDEVCLSTEVRFIGSKKTNEIFLKYLMNIFEIFKENYLMNSFAWSIFFTHWPSHVSVNFTYYSTYNKTFAFVSVNSTYHC